MKLLIFLIVSIVSSLLVYIAPGNNYRGGLYENNHQLVYSLQKSAIELTGFITYKNITLPFIIVNIIFIIMSVKIVSGNNFSGYLSINPLYPVIISLAVLYSGFFASYWSLGLSPFPRILNVIYFFFLLGWFFNLFLIINYAYKKFKFTLNFPSAIPYLILYSLLFFSVIFLQGSVKNAYKDLVRGTAGKFDTELSARYEYIYNDKSDTCLVAEIKNIPPSLFFHDITNEPGGQYNIIQAKYFNKKYLIIKGD